ncbi:MFS transporter [Lentzea pudingi]|uniref:MFS transporter n=1 Tax=Lentzea pudingi TaxID=1789439 RepID=A0ABQ2HZU4_9PSEU|nr:MFS transporter [Lentzea pudingi]GGM94448.1 MFS transporter [Lentzea pudingi]
MSASASPGASSRSVYLVVVLGFFATAFEGYDLIIYGSAVPDLLAHSEWGLDAAQVGFIGSAALAGMVVGALAAGWLSDRSGRRVSFISMLSFFSVMMIFSAVAPSPELLALCRFLAGIGLGGLPPIAIALVSEFAPARRRAFLTTVTASGFGVGAILASVLSIALLEDLGFRFMFALGGIALVTVVPLAIWLLPESPGFRSSSDQSTRHTSTSPWVAIFKGRAGVATTLFALANFSAFLLVFSITVWLPQLMTEAGYSVQSSLRFQLLLNVGALVGAVLGGVMSDRLGGRVVTGGLYVAAAIALGLLALPAMPAGVIAMLLFVAGACGVGVGTVLWAFVAERYGDRSRATALGFTMSAGRVGAAAGTSLGGLLVDAGAGLASIAVLSAAAAAIAGLAVFFAPSAPRPKPVQTAVTPATGPRSPAQ